MGVAFHCDTYVLTPACSPDRSTFSMNVHGVPPQEGDIVTFSFDTFSRKAVPLQPKLERIRKDMSWEDVLRSHFLDSKASEGKFTTQSPLDQN